MFQKTHDIDADSAMGVSIVTDDTWFSDNEEVSECLCIPYAFVSAAVCSVMCSGACFLKSFSVLS